MGSSVEQLAKLDQILQSGSTADTKTSSKDITNVLNRPLRTLPPSMMDRFNFRKRSAASIDGASMTSSPLPSPSINVIEENPFDHAAVSTAAPEVQPEARNNIFVKRWKLAINYVLIGQRFIRLYQELVTRNLGTQRATVMEAEGLAFLLSSHVAKTDPALTAKVCSYIPGKFLLFKD
jgi:hypothetical protein